MTQIDLPEAVANRGRIAVAINPTSGKGRGAKVGQSAMRLLAESGVEVVSATGSSAAQTLQLAKKQVADGVSALVVVGGDGMVNLGTQACADTGVPLGIVAAGSGNDFATALGLPSHNCVAAVQLILAGQTRNVDAVRKTQTDAGPQWFVSVLGGGFDAKVNERANNWRWPRGKMRYNLAILRELPVFKPLPYVLELDGVRWETSAMLVALGNSQQYGGGMQITPNADLTDGLLDVLVISKVSIPEFLRVFPRVFKGEHIHHPAVTIRRAKTVRLDCAKLVAYADGERFGALPLTVEVVPGALSVIVGPTVGPSTP